MSPSKDTNYDTIGFERPAVAPGLPSGDNFGDYVLLGELGRGGMGVVYKAYEKGLSRIVALKMILSSALSEEEELSRFRTEASAAARLSHPHIVKVHRVGLEGEQHYYAMDYINGPSLAQRLSEGPMPGKVAARYLVTIAGAIHHAHEQHILHRDLKPGNILLDRDDNPHVTDFGLAKQMTGNSNHTRTGTLLGTPSYMAPEQAQGKKDLTERTDVYGLGALLYELITARPPFRGETALDTVMQVMQNDPAPPSLLNPRVDRDLETICLKCLAKDPADRYATAEELAEDLERYLAGDAIHARSLNMLDYLGRTLGRSQFDVEFRNYANVVLWFAFIVGSMHVVEHFAIITHLNSVLVRSVKGMQFFLMVLILWGYRKRGLMPATPPERLLWSVWIGYAVTCSMIGHLVTQRFGIEVAYQGVLYPLFCAITGMAFLIIGSSYWGMCNLFSLLFFVAALVLPYAEWWGTLVYGGLWTVALLVIGLRLRKLGEERGHDG